MWHIVFGLNSRLTDETMESCSSGYQNLNDSNRRISNVFTAKKQAQDFEMSNVSVVPDGKYIVEWSEPRKKPTEIHGGSIFHYSFFRFFSVK